MTAITRVAEGDSREKVGGCLKARVEGNAVSKAFNTNAPKWQIQQSILKGYPINPSVLKRHAIRKGTIFYGRFIKGLHVPYSALLDGS